MATKVNILGINELDFPSSVSASVAQGVTTLSGLGTVTSFSAGNLSPLFTTTVGTPTTTPALSFSLSNVAGGTVYGNNTTGSTTPAFTTAPVLGIPGTSTGTLALASSTASGKFTVTAPASAATPTLTLPTGSGVLADAGDGTVLSSTVAATGALALLTQTANTVLAGPTTGAAATPTFRALVAADIPSGAVVWNAIGSATGNLSLANAAFTTTFQQTSNIAWLWQNTTTATSGTTNASPTFQLAANYWTGAASAQDTWTIGSSLAAGTNGISTLGIGHSGSTGAPQISIPTQGTVSTPVVVANTTTEGVNIGNTIPLAVCTASGATYARFYTSTTLRGAIQTQASAVYLSLDSLSTGPLLLRGASAGNSSTTLITSPAVILGQSDRGTQGFNATSGTQVGVSHGSNEAISGNGFGQLNFIPASGTANFVASRVLTTINQTSTASGSYTGFLVNAVETSLKGTANKLLTLQAGSTGGTTKFEVNNSGVVDNYNGTTTVRNGLPAEYASSDLTAQSAAITATTLLAATSTGAYRVSWSATITTADGVSSVLGGTNGFQVLYTSPTDSVVKTTVAGNSVTSSANTTGTAVGGVEVIYAKTGTNIQFTYGYTSATPGQMVYELHISVEEL